MRAHTRTSEGEDESDILVREGGSDLDKSPSDSSLDREPDRHRPYKIPKVSHHRTREEITRFCQDLPNLAHHSDDSFRSNSLKELIGLNKMLGEGRKPLQSSQKNWRKIWSIPKNFRNWFRPDRTTGQACCMKPGFCRGLRVNIQICG